jgi:hypothetical protein
MGRRYKKRRLRLPWISYVKPRFSNPLEKRAGILVFRGEMAAQAGMEPGQPIWPSLTNSFPVAGYESQVVAGNLKYGPPSGELFHRLCTGTFAAVDGQIGVR